MDAAISATALLAFCNSPIYMTWLIGFILAIRRREKHPQVSRLAVTGIAILFASKLLNSFALNLAAQGLVGNDASVGAVQLIFTLADTVGWIFILRAILRYRGKRKPEYDEDAEFENE